MKYGNDAELITNQVLRIGDELLLSISSQFYLSMISSYHWLHFTLWVMSYTAPQLAPCEAAVVAITSADFDGNTHTLSLRDSQFSEADLREHKMTIDNHFTHEQRMGCSSTFFIEAGIDYMMTFATDRPQLCHNDTKKQCIESLRLIPSPAAPSSEGIDIDLTGLALSEKAMLRMERRRMLQAEYTWTAQSLCAFDATMRCSAGVTVVLDLDCGDHGVQLGQAAMHYKYVCVAGSHEVFSDNTDFFSLPNKEFILADIYSPDLFAFVKGASVLWKPVDTVAVVARYHFEFMPYTDSLALLSRMRHSGAAYFVGSNTAGVKSQNPIELISVSGYTPLNMQRYPFQLGHTRMKWREAATHMTEVWDLQKDLPVSYPYYYDNLICGDEASDISRRLYGPNCDKLDKSSSADWALFVHRADSSETSQGGQDGAIDYIFKHIGTTALKSFVEFGFNGPTYEEDTGANTNHLHKGGWRGLLLDGGHSNPALNLHKTWIKPETIVSVFDAHKVPEELDYLSIDIDSSELWIFRAILSSGKYRPRVVSVEYNCNYPLEATLANIGGSYRWQVDMIYGTALLPLKMVADEFGYSLVDVIPYLDAIFVRNDLLKGSRVPDFETWRPFTKRPHHLAGQRTFEEIGNYLVDYAEWIRNGHDMEKAKGKVVFHQIESLGIII